MCMILYHPAGAAMPTSDLLLEIIRQNPHGFGLWVQGKVYHTMNSEKILDRIFSLSENTSFVFHARIATRGKIQLSNCHPFVSKTEAFFHNGTFNLIPFEGKTDSETLFMKYVAGKRLKPLPEGLTQGSRMCLIRKGVPYLYGDWWKCSSSGNYFSHWIAGVDETPHRFTWSKMEGDDVRRSA